jgi:hypothetical protein
VARLVLKYLPNAQAADLQQLLREGSFKVKHTPYDWAFRGFAPPPAKS